MPKTEQQLRDDIIRVGRLMFDKGWIAANDGNITIRLDENLILATPTGICKGMMSPDDLILCDLDGEQNRRRAGAHLGDGDAPHHLQAAPGYPRRSCMRILRWPPDSPSPAAR